MSQSRPNAVGKTVRSLSRVSADSHEMRNAILLSLPGAERKAVLAKAQFVLLPSHNILNDVNAPIQNGYFMNSGLASQLQVLSGNKSVEVGLIGSEGFVGLPLAVGFATSPVRTISQTPVTALRVNAKDLRAILSRCPVLREKLNRYSQELSLQGTLLAACNRLHQVNKRLARWLLMSQDRVGSDSFQLTQESLAAMLGTRRASVTTAAGTLQKAGLITYRRGRVKIDNRPKLEEASCECYKSLTQQMKAWRNHS